MIDYLMRDPLSLYSLVLGFISFVFKILVEEKKISKVLYYFAQTSIVLIIMWIVRPDMDEVEGMLLIPLYLGFIGIFTYNLTLLNLNVVNVLRNKYVQVE